MKPPLKSTKSAMQPGNTQGVTRTNRPDNPEPISSAQLLCGRKQVEIVHNGAIYRLQETRYGKLILTK